MISVAQARKYCKDDISKIENYQLAIADKTQKWHLHHKLEIIENKTAEQLKKEGRYNKRPASELILLTSSEHRRLHQIGDKNTFFGKHHSIETKRKLSIAGLNNPKKSLPVLQFTKTGEFVAEYPSIMEAKRITKINHGHIWECCQGKRKSAGGYVWKYKSLIIKQ